MQKRTNGEPVLKPWDPHSYHHNSLPRFDLGRGVRATTQRVSVPHVEEQGPERGTFSWASLTRIGVNRMGLGSWCGTLIHCSFFWFPSPIVLSTESLVGKRREKIVTRR